MQFRLFFVSFVFWGSVGCKAMSEFVVFMGTSAQTFRQTKDKKKRVHRTVEGKDINGNDLGQ